MSILVGPTTLSATGGVISKLTGFTVHTFSTPGPATFTPSGSGVIEVLVVGGGGATAPGAGGVGDGAAGGGGGAVIYNKFVNVTSGTPYPITVGPVGAPNAIAGVSACFGITANGGGAGSPLQVIGVSSPQASGGGGGGNLNTPPKNGGTGAGVIGLGHPGGGGGVLAGSASAGGGGGGAGASGGTAGPNVGGTGGIGVLYSITGTSSYYGAGAGGRGPSGVQQNPNGGLGGTGYGFGGQPGAVIIRYPS